MADSFKPRSIFQSTTRSELRGHDSHWRGAKFSAVISFVDTKLNCGRYQLWEYILLCKREV